MKTLKQQIDAQIKPLRKAMVARADARREAARAKLRTYRADKKKGAKDAGR